MPRRIPLEPAAVVVCDNAAVPPLIFQRPPKEGRELFEEMQDTPVCKYPADIYQMDFDTGKWGQIPVYFVEPKAPQKVRSVILYMHGGGWVFCSFHTHEKLVRELAARTNSLVIFPEYSRSPEAKFPTAIEQCYSVLSAIPDIVQVSCPEVSLETLTVAGDSAGGNMATVMTIMSKYRGGIKIHKQLLYYPITDDCFETETYLKFAKDYYLYRAGMMWFWQQYAPYAEMRNRVLACPLKAQIETLEGLPQAMIITDEADVLRQEGEHYARKLRMAGVDVAAIRIQAITHDFVMLNALDQTEGCRSAMNASVEWINDKNWEVIGTGNTQDNSCQETISEKMDR